MYAGKDCNLKHLYCHKQLIPADNLIDKYFISYAIAADFLINYVIESHIHS